MRRVSLRLLGILLAISALIAACSDQAPEALIRSARQYIAKNEAKEAIIQLKTVLDQEPTSAEARFLLGSALLDTGDGQSADTELRKALELGHPPETVAPVLARTMLLAGQHSRLTAELGATEISDAIASADLQTSLALAYFRQGQAKEADAALAKALNAAPKYGRAWVLQATFKAEARDMASAFVLLDEALRDRPDNYEAWQLKGDLLYLSKRDPAAALDAHRKALTVRGDLVASHASILSILLAQHDLAAAKSQLAQLKAVAPGHPHTKYYEAELAFADRDFKTAKEIAQQLLRFAPESPRILQLAGVIEFESGSMREAEKFLGKALHLAPETVATRRLLVQAHLRLGQPDQALKVLAPLLVAPKPDSQSLVLAAQVHLFNGDAKTAEGYFAQAAKLDPNDMRSRTALALGQFSRGQAELGFSQLEEIAASDKATVADMALISTRLRNGEFEAALKAIDGFERKQPNTAMAANLRGLIALTRKDLDSAGQLFTRALAIDPMYFPAVVGLVQMDLAANKPEQARKRLDAVLQVEPEHVRANMAIAGLRANARASKEEVIALMANAVTLKPTDVKARLLLIDAQLKSRDVTSALATAQDGVAARPDSPDLLRGLARVQLALGEFNQAIMSLSKVAEMQPRLAETHLQMAQAYVAGKSTDAARQSFMRALAIRPDLPAAQRGLMMLELSAGRPKAAMAIARAVQKIPGREAVGLLYVGDIEALQSNWGPAASAYRASLKSADVNETAIKLHTVLLSSKQAAQADGFAAEWIKQHPESAAFLAYLGDLALARQDYPAAEDRYTAAVRLQPNSAGVLNNLAIAMSKQHKPGALPHAEKAHALEPGHPAMMDTLAMILADSNQIGKAIELEKRAVELLPEMHKLRLNLATLYIRAGQKALAKTELEHLAELGDKFSGQPEVTRLLKSL